MLFYKGVFSGYAEGAGRIFLTVGNAKIESGRSVRGELDPPSVTRFDEHHHHCHSSNCRKQRRLSSRSVA